MNINYEQVILTSAEASKQYNTSADGVDPNSVVWYGPVLFVQFQRL